MAAYPLPTKEQVQNVREQALSWMGKIEETTGVSAPLVLGAGAFVLALLGRKVLKLAIPVGAGLAAGYFLGHKKGAEVASNPVQSGRLSGLDYSSFIRNRINP